ncbi:polyglutamylase complex subunit TTLL1-like [Adelges cooleyi]|uniref:polyglutamylase complex subunit TTLL1-like n=1 Tax=Adelges cooleyi TaxID=133065 RepID=UPI00217FB583|nr:polyglutamylase complex subunit TTLL1-like [Adelges cooleyi]
MKVNYCVDSDRSALMANFQNLNWTLVSEDKEWNFYWANTQTTRALFNPGNRHRLNDHQMVNHFPNSCELGRKDLLVRNLKRYRKHLQRSGDRVGTVDSRTRLFVHMDFIPASFVLPGEYSMFVEEFNKTGPSMWIMKPSGRCRGAGIFLINKLAKLRKWARESKEPYNPNAPRETYVVSRYVERPLLIGGRKFDLRIYVLVTSFRPLKAYMYKSGFCRFCTEKYTTDLDDIDNVLVHLTNVSVQKTGREYNSATGGKLSIHNLRLLLVGTRGKKVTDHMFDKIVWLIVHTLKSVSTVIVNDRHCFECYGFDIIIDDTLKPWLIEVNTSPSLTSTTNSDRVLKTRLVSDVLSVVLPPAGFPNANWHKNPPKSAYGDFELLVDEPHAFNKPSKSER